MDIEAAMKRIPPHSIEAEQAVLGAMLMNKDAVMVASEMLTGDDFYQTAYGILFDAGVELFKEGRPVDQMCIRDSLHAEGDVRLWQRGRAGDSEADFIRRAAGDGTARFRNGKRDETGNGPGGKQPSEHIFRLNEYRCRGICGCVSDEYDGRGTGGTYDVHELGKQRHI